MVASTTLYDTLEVSPDCSEAELRKSYRKLCLKHHPDKQASSSSGAPVDSTKFQAIQSAYEVLGDPKKRAEYDEIGDEDPRTGGRGGGGAGGMEEDFMNDLFGGMFGGMPGGARGGGGPRGAGPRRARKEPGPTSRVELEVTLEELFKGVEKGQGKKLELQRDRKCARCKGSGAKPNTTIRPCNKCNGLGVCHVLRDMGQFMARVPMTCTDCKGAGKKVRAQDACKSCLGKCVRKEKKKLEVVIERGMLPGDVIVMHGEGDETADSSAPGNLEFHLSLHPHPTLSLSSNLSLPSSSSARGADLHMKLSVTLSESLLGFSRLVCVHLDGRGLRVTQPAPNERGWRVLKPGEKVVVKNEGMWPRRGGPESRGDLVCEIEVQYPDQRWASDLKDVEVRRLKELLGERREDPGSRMEVVEEVEFGAYRGERQGERRGQATEDDYGYEYEDDERAQPGCQQQ